MHLHHGLFTLTNQTSSTKVPIFQQIPRLLSISSSRLITTIPFPRTHFHTFHILGTTNQTTFSADSKLCRLPCRICCMFRPFFSLEVALQWMMFLCVCYFAQEQSCEGRLLCNASLSFICMNFLTVNNFNKGNHFT
jgi:hypothetical protein